MLALVVTVVAVVVVVLLAGRARSESTTSAATGPLPVPAVDQPGATGKSCSVLMEALPNDLNGLSRRTLADAQQGVAAWGNPAVVLRCGVQTPAELTCSSALQQFNGPDQAQGVAWLRLSDSSATTYIAVDRAVRIAVTLPPGAGIGAIQQVSEIIAADLAPRSICASGELIPAEGG